MAALIRFLRGNYTNFASNVGTLQVGEPCLVHMLAGANVYEALMCGGNDGTNKILSGFQTVAGAPPNLSAPTGFPLADLSAGVIYCYNGSGWIKLGQPNNAAPANIDCGTWV